MDGGKVVKAQKESICNATTRYAEKGMPAIVQCSLCPHLSPINLVCKIVSLILRFWIMQSAVPLLVLGVLAADDVNVFAALSAYTL